MFNIILKLYKDILMKSYINKTTHNVNENAKKTEMKLFIE